MDLKKILEKKGLEASGSDSKRMENYNKALVKFKEHYIPREQYGFLEELASELDIAVGDYGTEWIEDYDLSKNFDICIKNNQITKLKVNYHNLKKLPGSIGSLGKLEFLDLTGNELEELPASMSGLKELRTLELYSNRLTALPDCIDNFSKLEFLNVDCNELRTLPDSIGELTLLEGMYLNGNNLVSLPDSIGDLSILEELDLTRNSLVHLPDSMVNLPSLECLWLSYNRLDMESLLIINSLKEKGANVWT